MAMRAKSPAGPQWPAEGKISPFAPCVGVGSVTVRSWATSTADGSIRHAGG
jgi:hypothetical protein